MADDTITVTVNETTTVVTTSSVRTAAAAQVSFTPVGTITATNLQAAMEQLADQKFVGATQPDSSDSNLEEGDLWYNTIDDKLMVYRNTSWEEITLNAQLSEGSDTSEYTDITLNGGYF